jgi:hypothetical protein
MQIEPGSSGEGDFNRFETESSFLYENIIVSGSGRDGTIPLPWHFDLEMSCRIL